MGQNRDIGIELVGRLRLILSDSIRIGNECRTTRGHSTTDIGYRVPFCVGRKRFWRGDTQLVSKATGEPREHAERRLVTYEGRAINLGDPIQHHLVLTCPSAAVSWTLNPSFCSAHEHRRRKTQHVGRQRGAQHARSPRSRRQRSFIAVSWPCARRRSAIVIDEVVPTAILLCKECRK